MEEVKAEVAFFNNYILDPARPQLPEEKPRLVPAPPPKKMRADMIEARKAAAAAPKGIHARLGKREPVNGGGGGGGVRVTHANSDPRGLIDYSDIDASLFDVFG